MAAPDGFYINDIVPERRPGRPVRPGDAYARQRAGLRGQGRPHPGATRRSRPPTRSPRRFSDADQDGLRPARRPRSSTTTGATSATRSWPSSTRAPTRPPPSRTPAPRWTRRNAHSSCTIRQPLQGAPAIRRSCILDPIRWIDPMEVETRDDASVAAVAFPASARLARGGARRTHGPRTCSCCRRCW